MKFWMIYSEKNDGRLQRFDSKEAAAEEARRRVDRDRDCDCFILEMIGVAKRPVPPIEVEWH